MVLDLALALSRQRFLSPHGTTIYVDNTETILMTGKNYAADAMRAPGSKSIDQHSISHAILAGIPLWDMRQAHA